ncbi:hypothetical protein B0F90DRAFT_1814940 [Multifurca ochricompacta]|uniref:ATP-binding cassette transporter n=1 Tax=Multifurca ochricompacta TaxID=376703 RepID=A0AAD4QPZ8_9AGAM|nr:hypothetical protein B0F90DRAFT_1814940 [Multifurca ochricompacta]
MDQVVLNTVDASFQKDTPLWTHPLFIPSYFALASIVVLVLQATFSIGPLKRLRARIFPTVEEAGAPGETRTSSNRTSLVSAISDHVEQSGGSTIFLFHISRLVFVLTLLGLSIFDFIQEKEQQQHTVDPALNSLSKHWGKKHKNNITMVSYASFLALFTVTARRTRASVTSLHLSSLLIATLSVYAYRDVWPLLTFTLSPADGSEGALLWVKIGLLTLTAVVIPLIIPRQYVPLDPKDLQQSVNPEQTASRLSMLTYTFIDPIVFMAYRVPHLSNDMLPPLADYDYTKNLVRRSFKHLDTFSGSPRRHLFWGFMAVFRREYIQLVILIIVKVISTLLAPIGMRQLLSYLETRGEGAVVRPWVWVTYLFLGPAIGTIAFQWYIFISVPSGGLVVTRKYPVATPEGRSEATTPDNGSVVDVAVVSESAGGSGEESGQSTAASSVKGKQKDESVASESGKDSEEPGGAGNLVGKMNNLVSTDLENLVDGRDFLLLVLYLPFQVVLCVWFLHNILGWSAFVGMLVMVALFPVPGAIANKIQKVQKETMKRTDARVQTATETMSILRMIKLFGWEPKIAARLAEKREQELQFIKTRQILNLINGNINFVIPVITMVVTYVTYIVIMRKALTPSVVFSSMAVFDLLRDQLHSIFWMIPLFTQAKVSLDRVDDFLHNTELLDEFADAEKGSERVMLTDASHFDRDVIGFQNASFTWSNDDVNDGALTPSRRKFTLRIHGELLFKRGCFNLIIGSTGSGKTSLLMALLGEMHFIPMSRMLGITCQDRVVSATRLRNLGFRMKPSGKDNILFGSPYDEERYKKVIYQCGLQRDLSLFDAGDKTEVGEKGLTLSGGQKARVTLARAVYSSAEIIILDDVLAALDVHTARWIVDKCFKGDLIRGRTVLLVTHNVAMVSSIADYVISLGLDGQVVSRGSVSDALTKDKTLATELAEGARAIKDDEKKIDPEEPDEAAKQADGKLILAEEIAEGHVSWGAFKLFIDGLGGSYVILFWSVFVGGLLICDTLMTVQTWFMGYWAEQYDIYPPEEVAIAFYLTIYGIILLGAMVSYTTGSGAYIFGTIRASRSIHQNLIEAVLGTTLRWLDTTPTSRVITRVTQDIRALDGPISNTFAWFIEISATMLLKFVAVVYLTPIFVIPATAIAVLGAWLGQVYMRAQMAIKREMSNAKAPVLGHFGAASRTRYVCSLDTMSQDQSDSPPLIASMRAYGAQLAFREESYRRIDRYSGLAVLLQHEQASRVYLVEFHPLIKLLLQMDQLARRLFGRTFCCRLAAYLIYVPRERALPSDTGFSLTMAIGFSGMILWWVRIFNDFEVNSNSLERMHSYVNIEQEVKPSKEGIPPAYWPASGDLRVEQLSARYSLDGPKVFTTYPSISSRENVGRTGSGKSSLTLSLLRCIFTEGNVYYDGKLTSSINLDALRTNITIIPQTPELLSGTLRENLDPFSQHDDATLNGALRASGLFSLQSDDDEGRLTLDSQIASGGTNLSVGQRQILALARAIVRGSKLLILDEATSAIDYKTDTIIQTSLRNELKGDVTLITVAHRLQTIIDADKVMVLDTGRIVEFDKPSELLKIENGRFRSLVDESGDRDLLYAMANKAGTTTSG